MRAYVVVTHINILAMCEILNEQIKRIKNKFLVLYNYLMTLFFIPYKVHSLRKKNHISVLFVVNELPTWKTEYLLVAMMAHNRFAPIVGVEKNLENPGAENKVLNYCKEKGYSYRLLCESEKLYSQGNPDIVIYQKPYYNHYPPKHRFTYNRRLLSVYILYAFHTVEESWQFDKDVMLYSWQYYYENDYSIGNAKKIMRNKGKNIVVTGTPMMDELLEHIHYSDNPWRNSNKKKKIIYAPHCTIGDFHLQGVQYSTFLDYSEFMLEMAEKYKDYVAFAFKPHPSLYQRLVEYWGEEKAKNYYLKWESLENGQLELGKYTDLFFCSDAMIHDCASFTIEYLYTKRPVMYLVRDDEHHTDNQNPFGKKAYEMHYKGKSKNDIEKFIQDVIRGHDDMKLQRERFFTDALLPPHNKSACLNIINSILGEGEYA